MKPTAKKKKKRKKHQPSKQTPRNESKRVNTVAAAIFGDGHKSRSEGTDGPAKKLTVTTQNPIRKTVPMECLRYGPE